MAVVKSSSSPAAALLLAMLLLFAAASAAVAQQAPPPEEEEEEPGCPADINEIIVDAIKGRQLSAETLAKFDELSTREVFDCVCDNVVDAAGITSASPGPSAAWSRTLLTGSAGTLSQPASATATRHSPTPSNNNITLAGAGAGVHVHAATYLRCMLK